MEVEPLSIDELFVRIGQNDKEAFNTLFRSQYARLVQFAQIWVSEITSEEIVSDVFVWLWQNRQNLASVSKPDSYLYVSVRNRCINALRNQKHHLPIEEQPEMKTLSHSPLEAVEYKELFERLTLVINQLPEQQRIVFRMIKEDGLTAKQCAEILNLSVRTVETHIYKAVKQLEKEITDYLGYSPKRKQMKRIMMML